MVISTAADLQDRQLLADDARPAGARRRDRREARLRRYVRGFVASSERQLRTTLRLLLAVAILSVVLLWIGYRTADGARMSVLDAAYFTTETLTTVGSVISSSEINRTGCGCGRSY